MSDRSIANFLSSFSLTIATTLATARAVAAQTKLLLEWPVLSTLPRLSALYRLCIFALLAGVIGLVSEVQASGQKMCKPTLVFKEVQFSKMQPPTLERKWTAVLSVDASRCMTKSGTFEIGFSRLKENSIDIDFQEQFTWRPTSVEVSVDFWADEAVEGYWLNNVAPCPCRD